ncbi:MAG: DUF167 domain-containing protein [Acidimicrobiia bacterium]|nr:DUF167 domain-containing protein [Acidimicrobiia bacterium]
MEAEDLFELTRDVCVLRVHVQPGAGRDAIVGRHGNALKLKIRARPEGGAANAGLLVFLAQCLGVRRGDLHILSGHKSRSKRVSVPLPSSVLSVHLDRLLAESPQASA